MTRVNVVDPDSTDPSVLAEDRDTAVTRDATRSSAQQFAALPSAPVPEPFLQPPNLPPVTAEDSDTPVSDSESLHVDVNPLIPRTYPNIPANIVPPVPLDLSNTAGNQDSINQILRQTDTFRLEDEIRLNGGLQSLLNTGLPFGPNQSVYQPADISIPDFPYPQLIEDAVEYRARQASTSLSPVGVDPGTGGVVPEVRNALSGTPLSAPVREGLGAFLFGEQGQEFEQSLPNNPLLNHPLSIFRFGLGARDVIGGLGEAVQTNQFRRFIRNLSPTPGARGLAPTPANRFTANLGTIASRIVDPTSELAQRTIDTGDPTFLESLSSNSLVARDIFTGLASSPGTSNFNPSQGQFGDFGNAGVLSGLLYLANIPEGLASGALYQLTNFGVDHFTDLELGRERVGLFDAFRGRDLGFMQERDDARYLSFMGDNSLLSRIGIRNPALQGAIGFVTDVVWGGLTDFGISRIGRSVTKSVIDPAVARALPESPPSITRILNRTDGTSVVNLNRVIDDAIEARRLNPIPRTIADPSLRRGLDLNIDGINFRVRVARVSDLAKEIIVRRPTELVDNIRLNRLSDIDTQLADLQQHIIRNNLSIEDARRLVSETVEDTPLTADVIDTQIAVIENAQQVNQSVQRQIDNLLTDRRIFSQSSGNLRQVISQEIRESVARGATRINGNILTTVVPDQSFDSLIPVIPQISIQPSIKPIDTLRQYRIDPIGTSSLALSPIRRSDDQLTALAKFHNILSSDSPTLRPQQLTALQAEYPTLLSRYGNPIDDNLSLPVKRIELTPADPITVTPQTTFIPEFDQPVAAAITELDPISKRTVNSLSRRAGRVLRKLENVTDIATENRLLAQLDKIERRINQVFANASPDSVESFYIESLPLDRTPLSSTTTELARSVSRAESQFKESTKAARDIQEQLLLSQRVLDEQGQYLEELPEFERLSLHNEVATRNNYTRSGIPSIAPSEQIVDVNATTIIEDALPPITTAPRSLEDHITNQRQFYHGTKSRINVLGDIDYTRGSSVSNELGPGLYLTTDPELAKQFAKAHPATDRVPNPSLRQTDVGVVHQVLAQPGDRRILDGDLVVPQDSPIRTLFHELVSSELGSNLSPDLRSRLLANARRITRTKPYRDWFQSLRINWNRVRPDSQTDLVNFNGQFVQRLSSELGVYGASHRHFDGHYTLVIYNDGANPLDLSPLNKVTVGTGSLEEQRLSRYAVDLFAHNEFNTATTRSNLAASSLAVDQQMVNNLKRSAKEAYARSLDDTEELLRLDTNLQNQVKIENQKRLADIERRAPDSASNQLRKFRGDNNSPCI